MKNAKFERLAAMQRQYHRRHPWGLSQTGLYVPHLYTDTVQDALSWWDDVGFILNRRRVVVWWIHPRQVYKDAIDARSWAQAGEGPLDDWLTEGGEKNYRQLGRSRKKIVSHTCRQPSTKQMSHYDLLKNIGERLGDEGIDLNVSTSWNRERLTWAMGVDLIAPLEVRNEAELASVAQLARRLILGKTTLETEFPNYVYDRANWLSEQSQRK